MRAGDLKYRIAIKQAVSTTDALGQEIESAPAVIGTVWAAKYALSTKDVAKQSGQQEQAEAKFGIRYRGDITTSMTVEFDGKQYQITGTEEFEDRVGLYLFVRSINV